MYLTTNDLSWMTDVSKKEWQELCRSGKVFAWRKDEKFARWQIPVESAAMYLRYNSLAERAFDILYRDEQQAPVLCRDEEMRDKMGKLRSELDRLNRRSLLDERILTSKLRAILGDDIYLWLCANKYLNFSHRVLKMDKPIPITTVVRYLRENPDRRTELFKKHMAIINENPDDPDEPVIRHILMTYAYYTTNGYFV